MPKIRRSVRVGSRCARRAPTVAIGMLRAMIESAAGQ
jgi:hypothetical protein